MACLPGFLTVGAKVEQQGAGQWVAHSGAFYRIARRLFDGRIYVPRRAYTEMAEPQIRRILTECRERHGLEAIAAEHRLGPVRLGEASVIVAASAAHREGAFAGAREAIDRIKAQVPIWKRELHGNDLRWVTGVLP